MITFKQHLAEVRLIKVPHRGQMELVYENPSAAVLKNTVRKAEFKEIRLMVNAKGSRWYAWGHDQDHGEMATEMNFSFDTSWYLAQAGSRYILQSYKAKDIDEDDWEILQGTPFQKALSGLGIQIGS